jgi:hypothetical protein
MGGSQSVYDTALTTGTAYGNKYGKFTVDETTTTNPTQPIQGTPQTSWFSGLFSRKSTTTSTTPQLGGKRKKSRKVTRTAKKTTRTTTKSNKSK